MDDLASVFALMYSVDLRTLDQMLTEAYRIWDERHCLAGSPERMGPTTDEMEVVEPHECN
jgi:hypothetical protein